MALNTRSDGPRSRDWAAALLIWIAVFFVHTRGYFAGPLDTQWYLPTALSIVRERNLDLDEYADVVVPPWDGAIDRVGGHLYNIFPIGVPVLLAPPMLAVDCFFTHALSIDLQDYLKRETSGRSQVWTASAISATSCVIMYLMARRMLDCSKSLLLACIFGFCTSMWSTASRALWQHGPSVLMLTLSLYLTTLAQDHPRLIVLVGLTLGLSYLIRPTNAVSVLLLSVYVALKHRRYVAAYAVVGAAVGAILVRYGWVAYGRLAPPYYGAQRLALHEHYAEALLGNVASPARGLFVYTPLFVFSFYGLIQKVARHEYDILDFTILVIIILHWLFISTFPHWWAGHSVGPRFFTDMIPYFMYLLIAAVKYPPKGPWRVPYVASFAACTALSLFLHGHAATDESVNWWNAMPTNVDRNPERLWDWGDIQGLRGIQVINSFHTPLPKWSHVFIPNRMSVTLGDTLICKGYRLRGDSTPVRLILYWQVRSRIKEDLCVCVQMASGRGLVALPAQCRVLGAARGYPTSQWEPVDLVAEEYELSIPAQSPTGEYCLHVGVLDRECEGQVPGLVSDWSARGYLVLGQVVVSAP